jgi:hypothetical protein
MLREGESQETNPNIIERTIYQSGKVATWVLQLATGIADVNRCRVWYSSHQGYIKAAGTQDAMDRMALLLGWLQGETDRLYQSSKPDYLDRGEGKRWANAFRLGASSTIVMRLKEAATKARREMQQGGASTEEYRIALANADIETVMRLDAAHSTFLPARVETAIARLDNERNLVDAWMKGNLKLRKGAPRNYCGTYGEGYASGREAGKRANLSGPRGHLT